MRIFRMFYGLMKRPSSCKLIADFAAGSVVSHQRTNLGAYKNIQHLYYVVIFVLLSSFFPDLNTLAKSMSGQGLVGRDPHQFAFSKAR